MANKRVDCDGHVMEVTDELISFVGEPFKTTPQRMRSLHSCSSPL